MLNIFLDDVVCVQYEFVSRAKQSFKLFQYMETFMRMSIRSNRTRNMDVTSGLVIALEHRNMAANANNYPYKLAKIFHFLDQGCTPLLEAAFRTERQFPLN